MKQIQDIMKQDKPPFVNFGHLVWIMLGFDKFICEDNLSIGFSKSYPTGHVDRAETSYIFDRHQITKIATDYVAAFKAEALRLFKQSGLTRLDYFNGNEYIYDYFYPNE